MVKCLECERQFTNETQLHRHLRVHKLLLVDYYQKHYPRYDKLTGEFIKFKNRDFYLSSDFNNKDNLKLWLKKVSTDEAKAFVKSFLFERKERKKLVYPPTQVELRGLVIPGRVYIEKLFGSYIELCKSLGFKIKHSKSELTIYRNISDYTIIVDTREQAPLDFNLQTKREKLDFADYRLNDDAVTHQCSIERKNLSDLYGTLGKDEAYERFKREIGRAYVAGAYVIVLVEADFNELYNFGKSSFFNKPLDETQTSERQHLSSPEHILHNIRELQYDFNNIQFLFVKDRVEASKVVERLFACEGEYKEVDLQYAYDTGTLI